MTLPASKARPLLSTGKLPLDQVLDLTILLRRASGAGAASVARLGETPVAQRTHLDYVGYAAHSGADPRDAEAVAGFARKLGLDVTRVDLTRRVVGLRGPARAFNRAFGVNLLRGQYKGRQCHSHQEALALPRLLERIVAGVFGMDSRPMAHRPHENWPQIEPPPVGPGTRWPAEFARLYDFPANTTGAGQCIGILEFAGGFRRPQLSKYLAKTGIKMPNIVVKEIAPGKNRPQKVSRGLSSDVEVFLDLEIVASLAPGATIVAYFGENSSRGWVETLQAAVFDRVHRPSVLSLSWGEAEHFWDKQTIAALNDIFQSAAMLGITICCSSGDRGILEDETSPFSVGFPASSPFVLACGGTRLHVATDGKRHEIVWNQWADYQLASGGGVSRRFPQPKFQRGYRIPGRAHQGGSGRGLPDVAANASSETGFRIESDGMVMSMGGTSAAAPLWAALVARLNERLGKRIGYLTPLLYTQAAQKAGALHGITEGFNGASPRAGYSARIGWNACTGLGSPVGSKLLKWLRAPSKGAKSKST
jgi:kumamolisin